MENTVNLTSYQNVESLQFNLPDAEFRQYCELKLLSAKDDTDFIKKYVYQGKPMNVCELGCGNGKLLLAMERENMVSNAVGYEVSESRCKFANKFLNLYDSKNVQILNNNFLDAGVCEEGYDLIILVDIFLNFISPLYDSTEYDTMQWIYKNLREGGVVLFELEDYSRQIEDVQNKGAHLYWEEFPKDDPFKYGLYKLDLDNDGNIVYDKRFIRRDNGKEEYFKNVLKSYTRNESIELLNRNGLKTEIYPYYNEHQDTNDNHEHDLYRVLAWK